MTSPAGRVLLCFVFAIQKEGQGVAGALFQLGFQRRFFPPFVLIRTWAHVARALPRPHISSEVCVDMAIGWVAAGLEQLPLQPAAGAFCHMLGVAASAACCLHPSQHYVRHSGYSCPCTRKTSMLTGSLKYRDITCSPRSALLCLRNPEGRPGCCRCTVPAGLPKAILPAIHPGVSGY